MELQPLFVKKKKKRNKNETKARLVTKSNSSDFHNKNSDIDNYSDYSNSANNTTFKENIKKSRSLINTDLKALSNVDPSDSSEFVSKSMDVVVDIHRECREQSISNRRKQTESQNVQAFSKTNTLREKNAESLKINVNKQENLQRDVDNDDIRVIDSIDFAEEFTESPFNEKSEGAGNDMSSEKSYTLPEEKLHGRKQWAAPNKEIEEQKKPARKRWSKNASVIQLPETNRTFKRSAPLQKSARFVENSKCQSPVVQSLLKHESKMFGIDNIGFEVETEEILSIETGNSKEEPKIEMRVSTFANKNLKNTSSDKRSMVFREAKIPDGNLHASDNSDDQCMENKQNGTVLDSDIINYEEERPKSKLNRRSMNKMKCSIEENKRNSSNDPTVESDTYSSEETPVENIQSLISKGTKNRHKKLVRSDSKYVKESFAFSTKNSDLDGSEQSIITSDSDDSGSDRSRHSYDEDQLRRSCTKKKKKYPESQTQMRNKKDEEVSSHENVSDSPPLTSTFNTGEEARKKKEKKTRKKDVKYTSVTIHRADMLEVDYVTKHPMVKVHIVKADTGKYLKQLHGSSTYLQPIITGKFDFKENKSIVPVWEETLTFEHSFNEILKTENEQVVILFEIVDLVSFAEASYNYDKFGHEGGWYKIAWAFLKPVGKNNTLHVNKKTRLQLYKPQRNFKKFERFHTCEVYTWWKCNVREKYPSSLFVTVNSIDPPVLEPVFYRQLSLHDLSSTHNESRKASTRASESINLPKWTRLAAQSCKIPNELVFETETSENGCFYIAFSNAGKYLACGFSEEEDYPIIVYEVETKKIHVRFSGHKTFIYSLDWSSNDNYLLSVSSDQTARIWDVKNQIVQHVEMMPHPSYVYCGKFEPENSSIVATGCYDRIARVWTRNKKSKNRDLGQELEGHEGFINSMCFQKSGDLLTADSIGVIISWVVKKGRRSSSKKEWCISRKIKVREIDGVIINTIVLHPMESRLLVHSRNSGLRMLDLATGVVLQKYNELNNQRIQSTACITPCGGLILCGGEDASLNVWHLETGSLLAKYTLDRNYRAVTCVDYHPYEHVLAFSTFGSPSPVRILQFNRDAVDENVGLKIIGEFENATNNSNATFQEKSRLCDEKEAAESLKERSSQSSRIYDGSLPKLSDSVLLESDKYKEGKMKLQRLNEAGQSLKSRSANRLYNIIEKIDRILSNTSRSSGDIESGRNFIILKEPDGNQTLTNLNENLEETVGKRGNSMSLTLSTDGRSNFDFEPSTTGSDKRDIMELHVLANRRRYNRNMEKRSRSAKEIRNKEKTKDDISKTFSDNQMNYERFEICNEMTKTGTERCIQTAFIGQTKEKDGKSTTFSKYNYFKKDDTNLSEKSESYLVYKNHAKFSSNDSMKTLENENVSLNYRKNNLSIEKHSESESSLVSNATFTIENEIPVPRPRRRNKRNSK